MANYQFTADILDDMLRRANETTSGNSQYEARALEYLNRAYRSLWNGATEFDQKITRDWWWLRAEGSIILQPVIETGTVSVTHNSASITLSDAPSSSVAGYFFKVGDHADVFKIDSHTAATTSATLDSVYTGSTGAAVSYKLFPLDYDISDSALRVIGPMVALQDEHRRVYGYPERDFNHRYPLSYIGVGVPDAYCIVDENTIRFNGYPDTGELIRVDYDYITQPADLTDSGSEEPLVPIQYRHVLADMGLFFLLTDKDESKTTNIFAQAKAGVQAMARENEARWARIGEPGQLLPRQDQTLWNNHFLRTRNGTYLY